MGILDRVRELLETEVSSQIKQKEEEFSRAGKSSKEFIFGELCFCILTANTSAELGLMMQSRVNQQFFLESDLASLTGALKNAKYRFYNVRSRFIVQNRWVVDEIHDILSMKNRIEMRDFLVDNLEGIGYKEASHFLRNVGIFDFAILDKHILRLLSEEFSLDLMKVPGRKRYMEVEKLFLDLSVRMGMKPGILDLYLWYIATGKVLK